MEKEKNKNINNPDDYFFKPYSKCLIKGCNNPAEWFLDDDIGLCNKCYAMMCKKETSKANRQTKH